MNARTTELIEHADRLHEALVALATSERCQELTVDFGHREMDTAHEAAFEWLHALTVDQS